MGPVGPADRGGDPGGGGPVAEAGVRGALAFVSRGLSMVLLGISPGVLYGVSSEVLESVCAPAG